MANYLGWLWREERGMVRALVVAVAIVLACAPGFAVSEISALSTVQVVHAQGPVTIHLGASAYDISQDMGDLGFPDDSSVLSITGPGGVVPVRTSQPVLSPDDPAEVFLGAWDCTRIMSFTIRLAGLYTVTVNEGYGISAAWISEPLATVARHVFPWAFGIVVALLTMAVCFVMSGPRRRQAERTGIYTQTRLPQTVAQ
jgi:hypothetical protein